MFIQSVANKWGSVVRKYKPQYRRFISCCYVNILAFNTLLRGLVYLTVFTMKLELNNNTLCPDINKDKSCHERHFAYWGIATQMYEILWDCISYWLLRITGNNGRYLYIYTYYRKLYYLWHGFEVLSRVLKMISTG